MRDPDVPSECPQEVADAIKICMQVCCPSLNQPAGAHLPCARRSALLGVSASSTALMAESGVQKMVCSLPY